MTEQAGASFWDDPDTRPQGLGIEVGETVSGTITSLAMVSTQWDRSGMRLEWGLDGAKRIANKRLHKALREARVEVGQRAAVTRLPDDEPGSGAHPGSNWEVKVQPGEAKPVPLDW